MNYLLDTNVISELTKQNPHAHVTEWINKINESSLYLSVLTIGELRKGIALLDKYPKKTRLLIWLEQDLLARFSNRILPIDIAVAERWGRLSATKKTSPAIDSLLAATALHHDLCLVTRNTDDFQIEGLEVFNPWD